MSTFTPLNAADFHHRLEEESGVSLVFFTHELCGSCQSWKKLLLQLQQSSSVTVFEVNAETEMALTNEFEVFHLPALFLYRDGRFHAPFQCVASLQAVRDTIDLLLGQPAVELP